MEKKSKNTHEILIHSKQGSNDGKNTLEDMIKKLQDSQKNREDDKKNKE